PARPLTIRSQESNDDPLAGPSFSRLPMRIFLLRARSTLPHTSMFARHTPLGLSRKTRCLHWPNSGRGERRSIPQLVGVQRGGLTCRSCFHLSLCYCISSSCCWTLTQAYPTQ